GLAPGAFSCQRRRHQSGPGGGGRGADGGVNMCLAIPGQLKERFETGGLPMGRVEFNGVRREVCLAYLPDAAVGDYVLVHVGFALSRVDPEEAARTLQLLDELGELSREGAEEPSP